MKKLTSVLLAASLFGCGANPDYDHGSYRLQNIDQVSEFIKNPLAPKERPMQTYLDQTMPVFDIHLHPGTFDSLGTLGKEFVLNTIKVEWLPRVVKEAILRTVSRFTLSPYGLGIGIQQECFRAKLSNCGLFAVHAPETWGVVSNQDVSKSLTDRRNFRLADGKPYFFGFATINMEQWQLDPVAAEEELRQALKSPHMIAVKLAFIHNNVPFDTPGYDRVYELAAEYGKPIYHHIGSTPLRDLSDFTTEADRSRYLRSYNPAFLRDAIKRHPQTKFILGHMGYDFTGEGNDFMPACYDLATDFPNVYLEMSAFGTRDSEQNILTKVLTEVKEKGLVDRLIYGSDGPSFPGATKKYIEATLAALEATGYSYDEARAVLYENFVSIVDMN